MTLHPSPLRLFALIGALAVAIPFVSGRGHVQLTAQAADHFNALGPDKSQARDDSLFFPNDFEAASAGRPDPASLVFFSRCRRAHCSSLRSSALDPPLKSSVLLYTA